MNDQVKDNESGAPAADAAGSTNAPDAVNNGIADQSVSNAGADASAAASAAVEPGTNTAAPESGNAAPETPSEQATPPVVIDPPAPAVPVAQPPAPVVKPVVQTTVAPAAQPSAALSGPTKYEEVNRALAGVPKGKLGIIHFLTEYSVAMAPRKPITPSEGGHQQAQLYHALINLINKEDEHFKQIFSAVLRYVEMEIEGVFSHTHAFRFTDVVPLNAEQRSAFNSLVWMLRLTASPKDRKEGLKQVSLEKSLQKGVTDAGRQRVLAFYND